MSGKVFLIGAGPGDPELMTLRALRMLQEADVVVYDRLVSADILNLHAESARLIPVGKAPKCHTVPQDRINEILLEEASAGHTVARLKGGDPMIFGRGSEEAAYLMARGVAVEYAPGITAAQGASCSTGVPLTHRGLATSVQYVTGHRQADKVLDLDWKRLADPDSTLVVYMGVANIGQIAMGLMTENLPGSTPVLAVGKATTPDERRLVSRLDQLATDVRAADLKAPTLFIIGKVVSLYAERPVAELLEQAHG
ncbi:MULTISPECIES: uroporphyrinogen-III C-methyltransferase [unclassified Ruegeria]|uniref:uroporphyrinogen-III C-methyltransferase n=1 Tax=unclassified Ruegeria TaxID=2625375 RepID=UPI001269368A|nr:MULTISPECIES: uroporphyrinogen-III C-methyltransferase [unclassified Ruegeria]NOC92798.1 uroporphyrinogen-III C-methyltransferase [Ruegeria sp. HKCCD6604]NOD98193.1 uroporphyrinogen-III C-methyltransferase [Ruegeria sp. HKCCD6228]QFT75258.1 Uroporphyrinogen-III C-methyltransferase [Ruegeria sp. THAF33]